jgi:FAD:protein FMN transferase
MRRAATTSDARRRSRPARLAVLALLLASCAPAPTTRTEQLHVFGSIAELQLRDADPAAAQAALAEVSAELGRLHREWHAWEQSDLTRVNAAFAAGRSVEAPPSLVALVERSQPLAEASDGLFDPAVGGLVAAWGFHTSVFPVVSPAPSPDKLEAWLRERPRIGDVVVDGRRLSTRNRRVQLDFGAIAEGMAAETTAAILRRHGVEHALVNLGGDVVAVGDGVAEPWRVGLRDPFGGGVLGGVELGDGESLFSTGNYNRFRASPSGTRWAHILDPRTGYPARGAAAVVVLHSDPVRADAAATALYVAGPAGFETIARRLAIGCALMVTDENELLVSRAMAARVVLEREPVALGPPVDLGPDCR